VVKSTWRLAETFPVHKLIMEAWSGYTLRKDYIIIHVYLRRTIHIKKMSLWINVMPPIRSDKLIFKCFKMCHLTIVKIL